MKRKWSFLASSVLLIALLVCYAMPAAAQPAVTQFTVRLLAIELSVSPAEQAIPPTSIGGSQQSDTGTVPAAGRAPLEITNNSTQAVIVSLAGTNAQDLTPGALNPLSWELADSPGADQYSWGFSTQTTPTAFTQLIGPGTTNGNYPTLGPPVQVGQVAAGATQVVQWKFDAPTSTTRTAQHLFNIAATGALP